ncbi:MAG TPA: DPP IV N-terminal domain-containing protein [Phycisphaerae bacterium]|nr:DPP IV N-terminal domain-containing protein [Phycisphaerae bacterium]HRY71356.1 DPP IV N-terminal domain-containing protein [Phycisphaerae bacterium]
MMTENRVAVRVKRHGPVWGVVRRVIVCRWVVIGAVAAMGPPAAAQSRPVAAAPRVYRDRVEPHWLTGNTQFWYVNELRGGEREFLFVDAREGSRRPAFDHAKVAAALAKATGRQIQASRLPIEHLEYTADGILLVSGERTWRLALDADTLTEAPPLERPANSLPAGDGPRASVRTGAQTEITFVNRTDGEVDLFWLDSEGERRSYGTIKAGERHAQHTYAGHVWLVTDKTGRPLGVFEATEDRATAVVDGRSPATRPTARERRRSRPRRAGAESPDGRWTAFIKDNNLWIRARDGGEEHALSQDGRAEDGYSSDSVWWSPDSRKIAAMRTEKAQEHKVHMIESSPKDQLQPRLRTIDYLKPGDRIARPRPRLFHVDSRTQVELKEELYANPWSIEDVRWADDSSRFTFVYNQRGHQVLRVVAIKASTGEAWPIIEEKSETFICYSGNYFCQWLGEGEILWMSERDGWNHLWLYDAATGRVKNRVTKGDWVVQGVVKVDAEKRQVLFRAGGIRPGQDPYYTHFGRVNLDGTGLTVLTEGHGHHNVQWSPGGEYYIDSWSRVDWPPVSELRRSDTGALVCPLEQADGGDVLSARGGRWPERFVAKGRDGRTDIHGIILFPRGFEPDRKYPVVENIYAGPQGFFTPKSFQTRYGHQQRIADLGMIVVQCDGMGTAGRSKIFHDVCWRNLRDAGLPDRIAWMKAAAKKFPQMDLSRVGIYGGSAGGQNAMAALLWHGDFYKVAVADCGCHDNRMDKIWWNEQWMGWPVGKEYEENSNVVNAHLLQGKLMLIVGELDSNVDPASTMQVVGALQKTDKDFDLVIIAGSNHGAAETPYGSRRRADFLAKHLLGR